MTKLNRRWPAAFGLNNTHPPPLPHCPNPNLLVNVQNYCRLFRPGFAVAINDAVWYLLPSFRNLTFRA